MSYSISPAVAPVDPVWLQRAVAHQAQLTMPTGALGRLLDLGSQLCAIQQTLQPRAEPAAVVVMAGDHGVAAEGVSAYPQAVTGQMVANFLRGGAAINVLARRQGARVLVVDMGVASGGRQPPVVSTQQGAGALRSPEYIADCAVGSGTANFLHGPAMSRREAEQAISAGMNVVCDRLAPSGVKVVALGEMGIGNTTSASALTAALTGLPAEAVTGRGTGLDDTAWRHKLDVVERALARHFPERQAPGEPLEVLAAVGGFEIAGMVGAVLEAARHRMLVVLDGFISSVAGLIAVRLEPAVRGYCVAAHRSTEPGHRAVHAALELEPLLDLNMRLGEGSGAALALNLLACAADVMRDMATFASAGVQDRV